MTASECLPQNNPVRRAIAAPGVSRGIHERLEEIDRVVVYTLPILGQLASHSAQHMGS